MVTAKSIRETKPELRMWVARYQRRALAGERGVGYECVMTEVRQQGRECNFTLIVFEIWKSSCL